MDIKLRSTSQSTEAERKKELQEILGKLLWVTRNTKIETLFTTVFLSQKVTDPSLHNLKESVKAAQYCFRNADTELLISKINLDKDLIVRVFCDASPYTHQIGSHIGYVACLSNTEKLTHAIPQAFISRKPKRKRRSSLHAELYAGLDGTAHGTRLQR
eukprot:62799-Hanusia_phi.AAC.1